MTEKNNLRYLFGKPQDNGGPDLVKLLSTEAKRTAAQLLRLTRVTGSYLFFFGVLAASAQTLGYGARVDALIHLAAYGATHLCWSIERSSIPSRPPAAGTERAGDSCLRTPTCTRGHDGGRYKRRQPFLPRGRRQSSGKNRNSRFS